MLSPLELCMMIVDGTACTRTAGHPPPCRGAMAQIDWGAREVARLREVAKSDAIEAGTRDAVERLVRFAAAQLAAGTLPGQVMADMLTTFTTAQAGDDELDARTAAEGVEVIAAGAVLLLAQERAARLPQREPLAADPERTRNPYCVRCGDTRGGPYGHESNECTWNRGPDGR